MIMHVPFLCLWSTSQCHCLLVLCLEDLMPKQNQLDPTTLKSSSSFDSVILSNMDYLIISLIYLFKFWFCILTCQSPRSCTWYTICSININREWKYSQVEDRTEWFGLWFDHGINRFFFLNALLQASVSSSLEYKYILKIIILSLY